MPAPIRPHLFFAALALAIAGLDPNPRPDFGHVRCRKCREPTPKIDERGSYNCINCGDALFVDTPADPPATTPSPETDP